MQMYHTDFSIRLELGEFDWISGAWQQNKSFPCNFSKLLHHMQKHVPLTHCFVAVLCPAIVILRILLCRILYKERVSEKVKPFISYNIVQVNMRYLSMSYQYKNFCSIFILNPMSPSAHHIETACEKMHTICTSVCVC